MFQGDMSAKSSKYWEYEVTDMKKKTFYRCLIGAPIGLAASTLIAIILSLIIGDGSFYAVVPELARDCGSELRAVLLQTICSFLYGAAWAGASVLWEMDRWSLLRQTLTHMIVCSLSTFPTAYFMRWMRHSVGGFLSYFGVFLGIYFVVWVWQYCIIKRRIRQIDGAVRKDPSINREPSKIQN